MRHTKHAGTLFDTAIGDDVNLNCNRHLETAAPAPALAAGEYEAAAGSTPRLRHFALRRRRHCHKTEIKINKNHENS